MEGGKDKKELKRMKTKKRICLNMIVKNESHVIRRCLETVKGLIDYWVIVDTGSTDGTQAIVREFLREIPGELHQRPWVNFGHNRNEALAFARGKADYILFIDADDRLVFSETFVMPDLVKDCYLVLQELKKSHLQATHQVVLMIKDLSDFKWEGALHEALVSDQEKSCELLSGLYNEYLRDGHRNQDPDKFRKDTELLLQAVQEDPRNCRNVFYLAQSYRGSGDLHSALEYYEKRAAMEGDGVETFYSMYCVGSLQRKLGFKPAIFMKTLSEAHLRRPIRIEPLFDMAGYFISSGNFFMGSLIAEYALTIPRLAIAEFLMEPWMHEWGVQLQYFVCTKEMGNYRAAYKALKKLLSIPNFPHQLRKENEPLLTELLSRVNTVKN